jgi:hypothetical protein
MALSGDVNTVRYRSAAERRASNALLRIGDYWAVAVLLPVNGVVMGRATTSACRRHLQLRPLDRQSPLRAVPVIWSQNLVSRLYIGTI